MTTANKIQKMVRGDVGSLLDVIFQEIRFLDEAPLNRHAANRLEIYAEQLTSSARKIYDLQREAD